MLIIEFYDMFIVTLGDKEKGIFFIFCNNLSAFLKSKCPYLLGD